MVCLFSVAFYGGVFNANTNKRNPDLKIFAIIISHFLGCIFVQKHIDYEQLLPKHSGFDLVLRATLGQYEAKARVHIQMVDLDDNAPELQLLNVIRMPLQIKENPRAGTKLADILILDKDHVGKNQHFTYKLTGLHSENFQLRLVCFYNTV